NGNETVWVKQTGSDDSYTVFRKYLDVVFSYAGTLSLAKELMPVPLKQVRPGDVLIQGGSPGHAVIVTDVAVDSAGNKIFMLAQSYMPAQEIHVLRNPYNKAISPWYSMTDVHEEINTPEWNFTLHDLKRFR